MGRLIKLKHRSMGLTGRDGKLATMSNGDGSRFLMAVPAVNVAGLTLS